jgi:hypothetical protein
MRIYETAESNISAVTIYEDGTYRWSFWRINQHANWKIDGDGVYVKHRSESEWTRLLKTSSFFIDAIRSAITEWALLGEDDE